MLWSGFNFESKFLDSENIIAKLHLVLQLEKSDPYSHRNVALMPLADRIKTSLAYVPQKYRQYVLALFANTMYFPNKFSYAVLKHLMNKFVRKYHIEFEEIGKECLVLEQDPTGIVNEFLRRNSVPGRLDKKSFPRTQQVKAFVELARSQLHNKCVSVGLENLNNFIDRKYWIILADNSLSGTSLCSDLKKLCELAAECNKTPNIVVLVRTLAAKAKIQVGTLIEEMKSKHNLIVDLECGLLLDETLSVAPHSKKSCVLFNSQDTFDGVIDACKWLANQGAYKNDPLLEDHKKNSRGDDPIKSDDKYDMAFGFKECGLTFVSSENCPSDSLPLFWYENKEIYVPPFPRVLSRIGDK